LHQYLSVTEQCACAVETTHIDPLLCDSPRHSKFNRAAESQSDAPPQGGLYVPGLKLDPPAEPDSDLAAARRIIFLRRLAAISKTELATQTSEASAHKMPALSAAAPSYPGSPSTGFDDEVSRLANEIRAIRGLSESNQLKQDNALENLRREI
jgi:hypothetical protein